MGGVGMSFLCPSSLLFLQLARPTRIAAMAPIPHPIHRFMHAGMANLLLFRSPRVSGKLVFGRARLLPSRFSRGERLGRSLALPHSGQPLSRHSSVTPTGSDSCPT